MTVSSSRAGRRAGYVVAVLLNAALLVLINGWPGWQAVPFLTASTVLVLPAVNASVAVNLAANLVYLVTDPGWLKALGDAVTTGVGLVALWRVWTVWPLAFGPGPVDWDLVARVVMLVAIVGSAIAIVVALVRFGRALAVSGAAHTPHPR